MVGKSLLFAIALVFGAGLARAGPIHDAAGTGNVGEVRRLIAEGADMNEVDQATGTPLHTAAVKGQLQTAELLVSEGASVDAAAGIFRATPLHMAALGGSPGVAALLLANGANVNALDASHNTPLHIAAGRGHIAVAELLLRSGADPNLRNHSRDTPVRLAGKADQFDIVDLLISRGVTPPAVEPVTDLLRDADPANGRVLFVQCESCHPIAKGGSDTFGPNLWGVLEWGKAGSPTFDNYSGAFAPPCRFMEL